MKCPYCGKELINGSNHCDGCGANVDGSSQTINNSNANSDNNNKNKSTTKNILMVAGFVIIILVALFIFDRPKDNGSSTNNQKKYYDDAVSDYLESSRKSAFLDYIDIYISEVRTKVNEGKSLLFFDTNTIYFVPVGDDKCIKAEKLYKSPFSDIWDYNFVGVVYKDYSYQYYAIAQDGSGKGIKLLAQRELIDTDLYDSYTDVGLSASVIKELKKIYKSEENLILKSKLTEEEINNQNKKYEIISDDMMEALTPSNIQIDKYVFIASLDNCSYSN